jgi:hypothetical protein
MVVGRVTPVRAVSENNGGQRTARPTPCGPQHSARPRSPAFTDRFCVPFHVHFLQPLNAVTHNVARFSPGRFEERPEKRQRKNAPVEFPPRRLQHDFAFAFAGSGVADGQANGDSEAECAENRWHRIFAQKIFRAVQRPARFLLRLVPRMAHFRGGFLCCSTKLLTPSCASVFFAWLKLLRWKRFVPRKIVFLRIHTKFYRMPRRDCVSLGENRDSLKRYIVTTDPI